MLECEKRDYLVKKGWKQNEFGRWSNPFGNQFLNLYSLDAAVLTQSENDIIDSRGVYYKVIKNEFGFGYDIRGRESKASKDYSKWTNYNFPTPADAHILASKLNSGLEKPKHPQIFNYSKVLILKEGMDETDKLNRYFYVPNFTVFGKIALKVILERDIVGQGYWYDFEYPTKPVPPVVSKEEAEKYPLKKDRDLAVTAWNAYERDLKEFYRNSKLKRMFEKVKKEKNPIDAAFFLNERKQESFEQFDLVDTEKIYAVS